MRILITLLATFVMAAGIMPEAFATNGMNMIGYGPRMASMGGASLAMNNDTNLINTNPAGITTIPGQRIDAALGILAPSVHYKNTLNDLDAESDIFPLPSIGYVYHHNTMPLAFGIGLYAQGGMGATYESTNHNIFRAYDNNPLTTDALTNVKYHSNIGYVKFAPTIAYEFLPGFSAGLALNVGYAMMDMAMPFSIDPLMMQGEVPGGGGATFGQMFAGDLGYDEVTAYADLEDGVTATGFGAKIGFRYQATDRLSFGFSYTSESTLDFSGEASMDMTSQFGDAFERMTMGALQQTAADPQNPTGTELQNAQQAVGEQLGAMGINPALGMKDEYDVDIEFSWPQEVGFGTAYIVNDRITIAADINWINWSASMEKFVMELSGGTNSNINTMMGTPDGAMEMEMPLDWDDQVSVGIGIEFGATERMTLRGGYNYAPNPIPGETVIPIFPAIVESHITLGIGYMITDSIGLDAGYEFAPSVDQTAGKSIIAREFDGHTSELGENVFHLAASFEF